MWKPALLQRMYLAKKYLKREREVKIVSCPRSTMSGLHSQRIEWEMLLNVGIQTKRSLNALTHCCIRPMYNASWPSRHSVDSTNYVSLSEVWSQGQGHGSVANGLLDQPRNSQSALWMILLLSTWGSSIPVSRNNGFVQVIQSISNTPTKAHFAKANGNILTAI